MSIYRAFGSNNSKFPSFSLCSVEFSNQSYSFPPPICPFFACCMIIICMKATMYVHQDKCTFLTTPVQFPLSPHPLQMQHYAFLRIKYFHQTMDHFFSSFLSLIPASPSFATCIACALLLLGLLFSSLKNKPRLMCYSNSSLAIGLQNVFSGFYHDTSLLYVLITSCTFCKRVQNGKTCQLTYYMISGSQDYNNLC